MNAQQLKNSILQMAVSGKLVPQDPNDEPAGVLLERIRKEKEDLIKAGRIKREKNPSYIFRGSDNTPYEKIGNNEPVSIADEVPFDIPDSWEWARWGSISESIQYGYNAPAQESGRIKVVRISDIQDGNVTWNTVPFCEIAEEDIPTYLLQENDILFARTGGTVGKSFLVKSVPEEAIYAGYLIRTRYSASLVPEYLKLFMESPVYWSQLKEGTTSTAQPNCNGKTLSHMLIPIPPTAEQRRIVKKLSELQSIIDKYAIIEAKVEILNIKFPDQLKKSILQQAVQGKLVPQDPEDKPANVLLERIRAEKESLIAEGKIKRDKNESFIYKRDNSHYEKVNGIERCIDDEIPFDIPDSWEWVRLSSLGQFSSGKTPSMADANNWNGTIPWVSAKDMKNPVIMDSEMHITTFAAKSMQLYPKGTLLLVVRSGILRRKLPLCVLGVDSTINQDIKAFQIYDTDLSEWLYYALEAYEPMILHDLVKSVTTVESLKFDEFSKMLIPLPSLHEQLKILDKVKQTISEIEKLQ